jgi:hypothetical protein
VHDALIIEGSRNNVAKTRGRPFAKGNSGRPKRRFSEFPSEPACNQKYAGGLEQGPDDEAEPVVAQRQALILQHLGIATLDWPTPCAQP